MKKLIYPCHFVGITQKYKSSHKAIDLGWSLTYGGKNHKIISPESGTVIGVRNNYNKRDTKGSSYGNYVLISHGNGIKTMMAHLKYNSVKVKVGDKVLKEQVIGLMGDTGHATGVHLHYEVRIDNKKVNPLEYTYINNSHVVGKTTKSKYKILYLDKEEATMEDETETKEEIISENIIFEYIVPKTGIYKIELNENEKLLIKD